MIPNGIQELDPIRKKLEGCVEVGKQNSFHSSLQIQSSNDFILP